VTVVLGSRITEENCVIVVVYSTSSGEVAD